MFRDLISREFCPRGRARKIVLDLYSENVAINAISRLISELPKSKILLLVYSRILLVATEFKIFFFFVFVVSSRYRISC